MKTGLDRDSCRDVLKTTFNGSGWALCIGSGTSIPNLLEWDTPITSLIASTGVASPKPIAKGLLERFSPDAALHAVSEIMSLTGRSAIGLVAPATPPHRSGQPE